MKPIKDWLETLPEPYRTEAFEEYARQPLSHSYQESLYDALWFGFVWSSSKQGHDYWQDIANRADQGELDQPNAIHLAAENEALKARIKQLEAQLPMQEGQKVRVTADAEFVRYDSGKVVVAFEYGVTRKTVMLDPDCVSRQ